MSGNCDIPFTISKSYPEGEPAKWPDVIKWTGPVEPSDMIIEKITISKHFIVGEPDPAAAEYINQVIRRAEGSWFSNLFDHMFESMFEAMPSPMAEDYRRRSVDITRACES